MNRMVSDVFRSVGLNVVRSNNDRLTGWRYMKNLLAYVPEEKEAQIKYFPECEDFERQMLNANYAGTEANPKEDMNTDGEDHSLDEARYFCMGRGFGSIRKREESYVGTTFDLEVSRIRRAKLGYPAKRRGLVVVA